MEGEGAARCNAPLLGLALAPRVHVRLLPLNAEDDKILGGETALRQKIWCHEYHAESHAPTESSCLDH